MGKSVPVTLGRFTFPSKAAARNALRVLRDNHIDGRPILAQDNIDLLLAVVAGHPQAAEKIGEGVAGFFVAKAPDHPTFCFYLRRSDGSKTDFSWNETLTPTDPVTRLRMACRNAIRDQKMEFKDAGWPLGDMASRICPITGEAFTREEAVVDHKPPRTLKVLVDEWLASHDLRIDAIPIIHTGDVRSEDAFALDEQRYQWRDFHAEHAQLRLISAAGNLIQGSRQVGL